MTLVKFFLCNPSGGVIDQLGNLMLPVLKPAGSYVCARDSDGWNIRPVYLPPFVEYKVEARPGVAIRVGPHQNAPRTSLSCLTDQVLRAQPSCAVVDAYDNLMVPVANEKTGWVCARDRDGLNISPVVAEPNFVKFVVVCHPGISVRLGASQFSPRSPVNFKFGDVIKCLAAASFVSANSEVMLPVSEPVGGWVCFRDTDGANLSPLDCEVEDVAVQDVDSEDWIDAVDVLNGKV